MATYSLVKSYRHILTALKGPGSHIGVAAGSNEGVDTTFYGENEGKISGGLGDPMLTRQPPQPKPDPIMMSLAPIATRMALNDNPELLNKYRLGFFLKPQPPKLSKEDLENKKNPRLRLVR